MMRKKSPAAWIVTGALVTAVVWGCQKQGIPERSKTAKERSLQGTSKGSAIAKAKEKDASAKPAKPAKPPEPPPPREVPKVVMDRQLLETCLVKVGDAMPDGELPDLDGKKQTLRSLFGGKLTVVLFWESKNDYAAQALRRLGGDVAEPFRDKGVRVVGINPKETPEVARKAAEEAGAKYVNLVDAEGAYFAKVAKEGIPRIYLLDAAGKILWFDVEYSSTTRRSLTQGIEVSLGAK